MKIENTSFTLEDEFHSLLEIQFYFEIIYMLILLLSVIGTIQT